MAVRFLRRAAAAATMLAALSSTAHAQYLFRYAIWGDYTRYTDGYPFGDLLCTGTTPFIHYDSDPGTSTAKIATDLCPAVGPSGDDFGAQFGAIVYASNAGSYTFYTGSDDGSSLFIDGQRVMFIDGEQPFHGGTVTLDFEAGTSHTLLWNYYANDFGGSAMAVSVDNRLDVAAAPEDFYATGWGMTATPDVPPAILVGTAFSLFGAFGSVRRRLTRRVAREVDSPADV
jgi:hypothetical protein